MRGQVWLWAGLFLLAVGLATIVVGWRVLGVESPLSLGIGALLLGFFPMWMTRMRRP